MASCALKSNCPRARLCAGGGIATEARLGIGGAEAAAMCEEKVGEDPGSYAPALGALEEEAEGVRCERGRERKPEEDRTKIKCFRTRQDRHLAQALWHSGVLAGGCALLRGGDGARVVVHGLAVNVAHQGQHL